MTEYFSWYLSESYSSFNCIILVYARLLILAKKMEIIGNRWKHLNLFDCRIYRSNSKTSIKLAEMENRLVASGKISQGMLVYFSFSKVVLIKWDNKVDYAKCIVNSDKIPSILPRLTSLVPSHFSIGKTSIGEFIKVTDNSPNTSEIVGFDYSMFNAVDWFIKCEKCHTKGIHLGGIFS